MNTHVGNQFVFIDSQDNWHNMSAYVFKNKTQLEYLVHERDLLKTLGIAKRPTFVKKLFTRQVYGQWFVTEPMAYTLACTARKPNIGAECSTWMLTKLFPALRNQTTSLPDNLQSSTHN